MNDNTIILIADDDEGNVVLIKLFLRRAGIKNEIIRFYNGQETLDYLFGKNNKPDNNYLLLLDITMPKFDEITVLKKVKKNQKFAKMPVLMLTGSYDPHNIELCKQLGCNEYCIKPIDNVFVENVKKYLLSA